MINLLIDLSLHAPMWLILVLIALENILILVASIAMGEWLAKRFAHRKVSGPAPPVTRREKQLAMSTLILNTIVTVLGLILWRNGTITIRNRGGVATLIDLVALILAMDLAMYVLHRMAHIPHVYRLIHRTHHDYNDPRPLTLFVMNPLEALSFGVLWLVLISIYDPTWLGMSLYLAFNVLFGVIGHIGVEPLPARWRNAPILRYISTSSFHAGHHHDGRHNFGFYTLIWDRLCGTLADEGDLKENETLMGREPVDKMSVTYP